MGNYVSAGWTDLDQTSSSNAGRAKEVCLTIKQTESIEGAWQILTGSGTEELDWSAVMSSKFLHFLCRSMGFEQNPPVPIDNAVMRNRVWPVFKKTCAKNSRPKGWRGDSFEAYCRYMSAVVAWSEIRNWSTTQLECSLFSKFGKRSGIEL